MPLPPSKTLLRLQAKVAQRDATRRIVAARVAAAEAAELCPICTGATTSIAPCGCTSDPEPTPCCRKALCTPCVAAITTRCPCADPVPHWTFECPYCRAKCRVSDAQQQHRLSWRTKCGGGQ